MNKEIKKFWIEELRSEKYDKTRGNLRRDNGKCCALGILATILVSLKKANWKQTESVYAIQSKNGVSCTTSLPEDLREEIGLSFDKQNSIINLNDSDKHNHDFNYIANYIETCI
jgi:hypothetical protein